MTRGRARVHMASDVLRMGRCGWVAVDCETDVSLVTCKVCLGVVAGTRTASSVRGLSQAPSRSELAAELALQVRGTATPTAAATPMITPAVWSSSCKGGEHRRCGACEICYWEREAERYAFAAPWNRRHQLARPEGAPRWPSLAAALGALVEFEAHERATPSALGGILDRIKRGAVGTSNPAREDGPLMRRAAELVRVRQALELAYPDDGHATISATKLRAVLLLRTPGVAASMAPPERSKGNRDAATMPTYEQLAELFSVAAGELQALVRVGRRVVAEELAARGLIPAPRPSARPQWRGHNAMTASFAEVAE